MRKPISLLLIVLMSLSVAVMAQDNKGPAISFDPERTDYGTVYSDDMPETKLAIEFTNSGDQPLVLSGVRACCGTQVRSWPREPILPGEKGTINVEFRLQPRPQRISRTVTVTSNSATNPTAIYRITGEVVDR